MSAPERALSYRRPRSQILYGHLALARISNSPTVGSNVLAGAALAGALQPNGTIIALAVALVLFYTAGMYLNDVCDYASDCRNRPERPLPSGLISRTEALIVAGLLFGIGSILLWSIGIAPFVSGLILIAVIVFYDAWHKSNPLSPLVMAACRLLVYVTAFLAFSTQLSAALVGAGGLMVGYLVGLTYLSKTENAPRVARYWPAVLLILPMGYFAFQGQPLVMAPLLALFAGWVAYSLSLVYRRDRRNVAAAIGQLIAGISLLDSLVLAAAGATVGVVCALAAFGATQFFQRYIKGT